MSLLFVEILTDPFALAAFKHRVSDLVSLSHDALHMHAGLIIWLVIFAVLGRRRWSGWAAWALVLALALWTEWMDFRTLPHTDYQPHIAEAHDAGLQDVISTMLWPTILMLVGPRLFRKIRKKGRRVRRGRQ